MMDRESLKALQAPLKLQYQSAPEQALAILQAVGTVDFGRIGCRVELPPNDGTHSDAGLHPKAGGNGSMACSGDMMLQALVSCAGTTLAAVTTSLGLPVISAKIEAQGTMDFRGTLGVDRATPVGFTEIEMRFHIESSADADQITKLIQLTERYCVVLQTLKHGVKINAVRV